MKKKIDVNNLSEEDIINGVKSYIRKKNDREDVLESDIDPRSIVDEDLVIKMIKEKVVRMSFIRNSINEDLLVNKSFLLKAFKECSFSSPISFIPSKVYDEDKEFMMKMVKVDGMAIKLASKKLRRDMDLIREALKQDGTSWQFLDDDLVNTREFLLEQVKISGSLEGLSRNNLDDEELVVVAIKVKCNSRNLSLISKRLYDFDSVMIPAIEKDGSLIFWASQRLQNEPEIVKIAIKSNPELLEVLYKNRPELNYHNKDEMVWLALENGFTKIAVIFDFLDTKEKLIKTKEIVDWKFLPNVEKVSLINKFLLNNDFKESYELLKKYSNIENDLKLSDENSCELLLDELISLQEAIDMKKEIKIKDKKSNSLKF